MLALLWSHSLRTDKFQTENLFATYSQFASSTTIGPEPTEDESKTAAQIEELLEKVRKP